MKERYGNRSVSQYSEESNSPIGLISRAYRHFVTFLEAALLKHDVQLLHTPGDILEMEGLAMVVGDRRTIPILLERVLEDFVY